MPMTGPDTVRLANVIAAQLNYAAVDLLATDLNVLNQLPHGGTVKERALGLISFLNGNIPPRDRELLEKLRNHPNAAVKTVANDILQPPFVSKTGTARDAVMLGRSAFIARSVLRDKLDPEFTVPQPNNTHVLIVKGKYPSGKSYSYGFLHHLAFQEVNAQATRLSAMGIPCAFELLRRSLLQLGVPTGALQPLADSPQIAREVDALIPAFKAAIRSLTTPFWLVIDDLNDASVTRDIREAALSMARAVEDDKPPFLWIMLLGYNDEATDDTLRNAAIDDAEFPTSVKAADFLDIVAEQSGVVLQRKAQDITDLLFEKHHPFAPVDKAAMKSLTRDLEVMAQKLKQGLQP